MSPFSIGIIRSRRAIKWAATVAILVFITSVFLFATSPPKIRNLKTSDPKRPIEMMVSPYRRPTSVMAPPTQKTTEKNIQKPKRRRRYFKRTRKNTKISNWKKRAETFVRNKVGWNVLLGGTLVHLGYVDTPHNFSYIIEENDKCKDFDDKRTKLLILAVSQDSDFAYRKVIRQTWGLRMLQQLLNFRIVFLLGNSGNKSITEDLQKESLIHGDIVQENFEESWTNLGKKTVMGLKWAVGHCDSADFILKTDQDIVIHVPHLLAEIERQKKTDELLLCHQNKVLQILRPGKKDVGAGREKYHVNNTIPGSLYPKYCAGLGYVMSKSVAKRLYETALVTPDFFIEDAFITGILRYKASIKLTPCPQIRINPPVLPGQGICAFNDGRITSSELSQDEIQVLWDGMNTKGFFCPQLIDKPLPKDFV